MAENKTLLLASSPHIASPVKTRGLMIRVLLALAPASIYGVYLFGLPALLTILVSVVSAILGESLFRLALRREIRAADCSSAVTGLLLALVLPPSTPLWMTALGALFAVVVAKEFFGGLGANVFNPALSGRAFLLMSFPAQLTLWSRPGVFGVPLTDAVSGPTPLRLFKEGGAAAVGADFAVSRLAPSAELWPTVKTLFWGNHGGCIGESSVPLILAGGLFLLLTGTIDWRAPAAMIGTALLASLLLPGMDPLLGVLSGGLLFGAVFMATDYSTAPVTSRGKLLFGAGAGLITVLIRRWGNYPEGVSYGILIMNAASPFLDRLIHRKYGFVPPKKPEKPGQNPAGGEGSR